MPLRDRVQGCVDVGKRIIWLDEGLTPVQARCVLAYEIAQYELGPTPSDPCMARAAQRCAEEWAALMLVSSDAFAEVWAHCLEFNAMAAWCCVDVPTFRARIRAATDCDQDRAMRTIVDTRITSA